MEQGQRFGLLTVSGISDEKRNGERIVLLQCDCGEQTTSVGSTLRAGKKLSCGCRRNLPRRRTVPLLWDSEWLRARYEGDQWSQARIASEIGCSQPAVFKALRHAGIQARPYGSHQITHGDAVMGHEAPTYTSWKNMKTRCSNPNNTRYDYYGGRGISVCERWNSYENFLADMGERPEGKSIDRIDVDGNYEPSNCRWATQSEQVRNRRPRAA